MFGVKNASTDSIIDQVHSQWHLSQNEGIKKEWYQLDENEDNSSTSGKKDSYWARTEELCGIESTPDSMIFGRSLTPEGTKKDIKNIHNWLPS